VRMAFRDTRQRDVVCAFVEARNLVAAEQGKAMLASELIPNRFELQRARGLAAAPEHVDELTVDARVPISQRCDVREGRAEEIAARRRIRSSIEEDLRQDRLCIEQRQLAAFEEYVHVREPGPYGREARRFRDDEHRVAFVETSPRVVGDRLRELLRAVMQLAEMAAGRGFGKDA